MAQERDADDLNLPAEPRQRGERAPRAEDELGLGGPGTEGKPGPPEGGVEPQIPKDVTNPLESEEEVRRSAEKLARDLGLDLGNE